MSSIVGENPIFFRNLTICNKIFKRTFLEKYNIAFPENYYHEDQVYVVKAFVHANNIVALRQPFYFYRKQRDGSVSQHDGTSAFDIFPIMKMLEIYFKEQKITKDFYGVLYEVKISRYIQIFRTLKHKYKNKYFSAMKRDLLEIHDPLCPTILSESEYETFTLIKNHMFWVCIIVFFFKENLRKIISASILGTAYRSTKNKYLRKST